MYIKYALYEYVSIRIYLTSFRGIGAETERSPDAEESGNSSDDGRVPTPRLKIMPATQRTHHDRTTPATGNQQKPQTAHTHVPLSNLKTFSFSSLKF